MGGKGTGGESCGVKKILKIDPGKSRSKLATILKDTKQKRTKTEEKKLRYKYLDNPVSTMSMSSNVSTNRLRKLRTRL